MKEQNQINQKQQRRFFVVEFVALAFLFGLLGILVSHFFETSVYSNIDQNIVRQQKMILVKPKDNGGNNAPTPTGPMRFQADNVIYNSAGQILNADSLGSRYSTLKKIKFNPRVTNKMVTRTAGGNAFRTLLLKVENRTNDEVYYVLIAENIDTQMNIIKEFDKLLIIILVIFWLAAILISYVLSSYFMGPILRSWNKQQEFVSNAAHELRTPLTIIQNKLEYLFTKPKSRVIDETEPINQALNETKRLSRLTSELLTVARSDSQRIKVEPVAVELSSFLQDAVEPYTEVAASQDKRLTFGNTVEGFVKIDVDLLKQVLVILLDNALKYTKAGDQIKVTSAPSGKNSWKLTVQNTGESISDADKKRIFERFYRVDKSRNQDTGGNGLGLSIASWIISQHHGKISVADVDPHGVAFTCTLPR